MNTRFFNTGPEVRPTEGPLRILHLTPSIAPSSGGPATVATHLAAAQTAYGHDVHLLSNLFAKDRPAFRDATHAIPSFNRVKTHIYPWPRAMQRLLGTYLAPALRTLLAQVDVVHIHGVWEPMLVGAAGFARKRGIPYIIRPCGMLDSWSLKQRALKKRVALRLFHRRMLDHAAFIHSLSAEESRLMAPLGLKSPQVVIPNGVSIEEVDTCSSDALYAKAPALRNHPYILFLGRLHYKKGLDLLAEAFAQIATLHPQIHLLVVGPDGGARESFEELVRRYRLSDRVHTIGPLVGPAKFAAYHDAECFCLPSRQEGFSNAIIEALASGIPVAISTECHMPEIEHIHAGKVFSLNPSEIAATLHNLLSAPAYRRQQMGAAGRQSVERHLTWSQIARRTIEAYEKVIVRSPATSPIKNADPLESPLFG